MSQAVSGRGLLTRFPQGIFILLIVAALALHWWEPWHLPSIAYRGWVGAGVIVVGLLWMLFAVWTMRRQGTSPMPWEPTEALVTTGPYRLGRNPIYLGDILIVLGLSLVLGNTWMLIGGVMAVPLTRVLVIRHEEDYMAERFGALWLEYCDRVRRWI